MRLERSYREPHCSVWYFAACCFTNKWKHGTKEVHHSGLSSTQVVSRLLKHKSLQALFLSFDWFDLCGCFFPHMLRDSIAYLWPFSLCQITDDSGFSSYTSNQTLLTGPCQVFLNSVPESLPVLMLDDGIFVVSLSTEFFILQWGHGCQ